MKNVAKQYNFIIKGADSAKYSGWFKGARVGLLNGLTDLKKKGLMVLKTEAVHRRGYGGRLQSVWLKRYSPQEKNWSLTGLVDLPSLELVRKSFTGSLSTERSKMFPLSPLSPIYSLNMGKQAKPSLKGTAIISLTHIPRQRRWETSTRQTLLVLDISGAPKELRVFILSTLLMWQDIRLLRVSSTINSLFLCAGILLMHGSSWEFPWSRRWITRWQLQAEADINTAYPGLLGFIFSLGFIWSSSLRESQAEMPLLRALMPSGKTECSPGIIVRQLSSSGESTNAFLITTITRNLTEDSPRKNTIQDSPEYSETISGDPSDTFRKDLVLLHILMLKGILNCLLREGKSPMSEKLIPMAALKSTDSLTSSEKNLKASMLLLLYLLIEENLLSNRTMKSSSLFLFRSKIILMLHCFHIQNDPIWYTMLLKSLALKNGIRCY